MLEAALEDGLVQDAAIAESEAQRQAIWKLREEHAEAQKREGASVKNDVSVPVSRVPELIARATAACEALIPGVRAVPFGHLGDGNIHFNLEQPVDWTAGRLPRPQPTTSCTPSTTSSASSAAASAPSTASAG